MHSRDLPYGGGAWQNGRTLQNSVSTLSNRIFNRKGRRLLHGFHVSIEFENTWKHVRICEGIELDREEYILSDAAILRPMNTFKTTIFIVRGR